MCSNRHPLKTWVRCHRERQHKGKHGAVALNAGQWIGSKPPGGFATTWGSEFEAGDG